VNLHSPGLSQALQGNRKFKPARCQIVLIQ
jgi:hypothetical protein